MRKLRRAKLNLLCSMMDSARIQLISEDFRVNETKGLTDAEARWLFDFNTHLSGDIIKLRKFARRLASQ